MGIRVFTDFDGTVTLNDVGVGMFERFVGERSAALVDSYHAGEISARVCFERQAEAAGNLNRSAVDTFVDAQEVDTGFQGFVGFCRSRDIPVTILSDGLEYYIDRILHRRGLGDVPHFANRGVFEGGAYDARLVLSFPFENADCGGCACCKRNLMLSGSAEDDFIVYVGEGFSDRCPAGYADVVFAKKSLQTYCQENNVTYVPWSTFHDVRVHLERLVALPTLRKRRRAELKRREAFIVE